MDDDDTVLQRVGDPCQGDGDQGPLFLMKGHNLAEVKIGQRVAADDEKGLVEALLGLLDAAGRAKRHLFD
jgi:hypothetical protein